MRYGQVQGVLSEFIVLKGWSLAHFLAIFRKAMDAALLKPSFLQITVIALLGISGNGVIG